MTVGANYAIICDIVSSGRLPSGSGRASASVLELCDRLTMPLRWASHGQNFGRELEGAGWVQKELLAGYVPAFGSHQLGGDMFLEFVVPKREALDAGSILEHGERGKPSGGSVCGLEDRHVELAQTISADEVGKLLE